MSLKQGEMLRERYRILHRMGDTTYRAMDMSLRQPCIIKEFGGTTTERVTQLANLKHSRLPRIIDLVRLDDGSYLVMDLIAGVNLPEKMFESDQPIELSLVEKWLDQLIETLSHLHEHQPPIVHGNVAIDNVVIRPNGEVGLTNFSSRSKDVAGDLKGLGKVLAFLLTNSHPPQSAELLLEKVSDLTGPMPQLAADLLSGKISSVEQIQRENEKTADSPSTVPLSGSLGKPRQSADEYAPSGDDPKTEVWGERAEGSAIHSEPAKSQTQDLGNTQHLEQDGGPSTISDAEVEDPERKFNWMWILVGISAGVILLCLACLGFVLFNLDEITGTPTPNFSGVEFDPEAELDFEEKERSEFPEPTEPQVNLPEGDPVEE